MATVLDVARHILNELGELDTMKLQKLCYYCQAWHLVWEGGPLFRSKIEAWANGPVAPQLYEQHRGRFTVKPKDIPGDPTRLSPDEKDSIDRVLKFYGRRTGLWLSQVSHKESPWKDARRGMGPGERGKNEITHAAMAEYYGGLV